jgi:hypothetical protein
MILGRIVLNGGICMQKRRTTPPSIWTGVIFGVVIGLVFGLIVRNIVIGILLGIALAIGFGRIYKKNIK